MSKSTTAQKADDIVAGFAGTAKYDKVAAVREFCNSDSAFLAWVKKSGFSLQAIRDARLIQQGWKALKLSRTIMITLRAIKAALLKLMQAGVRITKKVVVELLTALRAGFKPATFSPASDDSLIEGVASGQ
ncbi:hypothetical protein MASR1M60_22440 [Rhodocyclaceae bacterium]